MMTPARPRQPRRKARGQAIVETAIVISLFLFLTWGVMEGGLMVWSYVTLSHAAHEGGRFAALPGTADETAVKNRVVSLADTLIVASDVTVVVNGGSTNFGARQTDDRVVVTATYQYTPLIATLFPGETEITLSSSTEVMVE